MITKIIKTSFRKLENFISSQIHIKKSNFNKNDKICNAAKPCSLFDNQNIYCFSTYKNQNKLLKTYQKIKQKQQHKSSSLTTTNSQQPQQNSNPTQQQNKTTQNSHYNHPHKIRCQGCNVYLQSQDRTKYGFIQHKILKQSIDQNKKQIKNTYNNKITQTQDSKILNFMHEVQKQSGVKIFNQKNNEIQNLDNIQVLMRLQDKIDKYQAQQQLLHRSKTNRKQLLCFRCFSLKYHNRLPQQYDTNLSFTTDTTQFILNKMLNRYKNQNIQYLYLIDAFDILGTFQQWLFKRLINQKLQINLIINKIDVINKQYLHQAALHTAVKLRLRKYLKQFGLNRQEIEKKQKEIKIFYISCNSRDGVKKLKQYLEGNANNIQLVGYPNTGKTTLLNILAKLKKSTSKVPGTTITQHDYKNTKRKIYDMPGLYSQNLLYNLIQKPSLKSILTWYKRIAPGLLTHYAYFYGGKLQIPDVRIIIFGQGGACQSSNRWFIDNYKQFWKGLPQPKQLKMKKYQFQLQFINGKTDDLEIAGYGFIGFRFCIPNVKTAKRKLTLYLPQKIEFTFRPSILAVDDGIFHNRSAVTKRFMLERLTLNKYENQQKNKKKDKNKAKNIQENNQNLQILKQQNIQNQTQINQQKQIKQAQQRQKSVVQQSKV